MGSKLPPVGQGACGGTERGSDSKDQIGPSLPWEPGGRTAVKTRAATPWAGRGQVTSQQSSSEGQPDSVQLRQEGESPVHSRCFCTK